MALAADASAEGLQACGERTQIVQRLQEKYGEARQGIGLQNDGSMLELFVSPERRTWSLLVTLPSGMTCLAAAGEGWEAMPELKGTAL